MARPIPARLRPTFLRPLPDGTGPILRRRGKPAQAIGCADHRGSCCSALRLRRRWRGERYFPQFRFVLVRQAMRAWAMRFVEKVSRKRDRLRGIRLEAPTKVQEEAADHMGRALGGAAG